MQKTRGELHPVNVNTSLLSDIIRQVAKCASNHGCINRMLYMQICTHAQKQLLFSIARCVVIIQLVAPLRLLWLNMMTSCRQCHYSHIYHRYRCWKTRCLSLTMLRDLWKILLQTIFLRASKLCFFINQYSVVSKSLRYLMSSPWWLINCSS